MLPEFTSRTGFSAKRMLVLVMEYGSEFSGEDKDNFRYDRAVSHPSKAHNSNFLHPVLYYYEKVPTGELAIVMVLNNETIIACLCSCLGFIVY